MKGYSIEKQQIKQMDCPTTVTKENPMYLNHSPTKFTRGNHYKNTQVEQQRYGIAKLKENVFEWKKQQI
jgi:hypothetical protein